MKQLHGLIRDMQEAWADLHDEREELDAQLADLGEHLCSIKERKATVVNVMHGLSQAVWNLGGAVGARCHEVNCRTIPATAYIDAGGVPLLVCDRCAAESRKASRARRG